MIKAKKGLLIALFATMMIFAFGATSAFAATDAGHSFDGKSFDSIESVSADTEGLKVIVEPTCAGYGVGEITCDVELNGEACGAVKTVWIEPTGHKAGNLIRISADQAMDYLHFTPQQKKDYYDGKSAHSQFCQGYVQVCDNCGAYLDPKHEGTEITSLHNVRDKIVKHTAPKDTVECAGSFTCTACGIEGMVNDEFNAENEAAKHADDSPNMTIKEVKKHISHDGTKYVTVKKHTCSFCDETWVDEPVSTGYDMDALHVGASTTREVVKEATCAEAGEYVDKCNDCGYVVKSGEIDPLDHKFATETASGAWLNGYYSTEEVPCTDYITDVLYSFDRCSVCGFIKKSTIKEAGIIPPAADGSVEFTQLVPANCEQGAWLQELVKDAGGQVVAAYPLSDVDVEALETFAKIAGKYYVTIDGKRVEIPYAEAAEHKFGAMTRIADATCTDTALEAKVCENCNKVDHGTVRKIDKPLGHEVKPVKVDATCGDFGYTYNICTRCNEYISKDGKTEKYEEYDTVKPVVALGTECSYAWKVLEEATPFALGTRAKVCTVCNHELAATKESIAKTTIAAPAVKTKKTSAKVTVKAVEGAVQYQILVNGKVKVKNAKVGKNNVKKLKKNTTYKFQVKAIDTNGVEAKSAVKKAKTKKK